MKKFAIKRSHHAVLTAALVGAFALGSTVASASPIPALSGFDFTGAISPVGTANVATSPGWDFLTLGAASPGIPGTIRLTNTSGGAFTQFSPSLCSDSSLGGCGLIKDLSTSTVLPIFNFVTLDQGPPDIAGPQHAAFDLRTLTVDQDANLNFLFLGGTGVLHYTGFDDSRAEFSLTAQGLGDTSFSASIRSLGEIALPATNVPEPTSIALLGAGLLGLLSKRRRKSAATAA